MSSFDWHLRKMKYGFQLVPSIEFAKVRKVMKAKQGDLKSEGKGNMSKKSREYFKFTLVIHIIFDPGVPGF